MPSTRRASAEAAGSRRLLVLACCVGLTALSAGVASASDAFLCYQSRATRGAAALPPGSVVGLDDGGRIDGAVDLAVSRSEALCLPADLDNSGVADPATHLAAFGVREARGARRCARLVGAARVQSPLGTLDVDVAGCSRLLLPAAKDLLALVGPPDPLGHAVDHYACHRIARTAVLPSGVRPPRFPRGLQATVLDQFLDGAGHPRFGDGRLYDLLRPVRLCVPVAATLAGAVTPRKPETPTPDLLCYRARRATRELPQPPPSSTRGTRITPPQAEHVPRDGVWIGHDLLAPERVDTVGEGELCVPSRASPTACGIVGGRSLVTLSGRPLEESEPNGAPAATSTNLFSWGTNDCDPYFAPLRREAAGPASVTIEYYDVTGANLQEVALDIFDATRGKGFEENGRRYAGLTRLTWSSHWEGNGLDAKKGVLSFRITRIDWTIVVKLPRWKAPGGTPQKEIDEWNRFVAALEVHENGHVALNQAAAQDINEEVLDPEKNTVAVSATKIPDFDENGEGKTAADKAILKAVDAAADSTVRGARWQKLNDDHDKYDDPKTAENPTGTAHGKEQGATLSSTP